MRGGRTGEDGGGGGNKSKGPSKKVKREREGKCERAYYRKREFGHEEQNLYTS